jgi:hypothetical protein
MTAVKALIDIRPKPTVNEIRHALTGNTFGAQFAEVEVGSSTDDHS